jgi:hypothetical protein
MFSFFETFGCPQQLHAMNYQSSQGRSAQQDQHTQREKLTRGECI